MGNVSISCCRSKPPRQNQGGAGGSLDGSGNFLNGSNAQYSITNQAYGGKKLSIGKEANDSTNLQHQSNNLQHISEREPDDSETDPSSNPFNRPIFAARSSYSRPRGNSYNNDSYSSNNSTTRKLNNTPLTSSRDHGYNSGTSTNLTQYESHLNDSFETSLHQTNITTKTCLEIASETRPGVESDIEGRTITRTNNDKSIVNSASKESNLLIFDTRNDQTKPFSFNSKFQPNLVTTTSPTNATSTHRDVDQNNSLYPIPKSSSCSTIFIDDSTISQPNLKQTIKCVSLAIYYHIKNRTSDNSVEIFDESIHPLRVPPPNTPDSQDFGGLAESDDEIESLHRLTLQADRPNQKTIYSFVKTLFKAAALTSEYAITTLVYLERLMTYAEMDLTPKTWRRMFLGAILLSSKVWEDQAVWNVDYAQILEEISVEDINELERQFLELIQFNMNVPSSVYAKYYFHLRTLSLRNGLSERYTLLKVGKARQLEAMSRIQPLAEWNLSPIHRKSSPTIKRHTSLEKLRINGQAQAVLM